MLAEAIAAGIAPRDFWDLTYRELFAVFEARNINTLRAHRLAIFESWHGAAFYRQKKLSPLAPILKKMEPSKPMSKRAMRAAIISIAMALGAKMPKVKPKES